MSARLQVMSDLHLEFYANRGNSFIRDLAPIGDILVLAGDICAGKDIIWTLAAFAKKYEAVVYVPGNHEYYGNTPAYIDQQLKELSSMANVFCLNNASATIDGVRFVGHTLWFRRTEMNKHVLNDFSSISDFEPWVYEENTRAQRVLLNEIDEGNVVVTHHMPSQLCVVKKFAYSALNQFFVCEMDDAIRQRNPAVWISGHTHEGYDFQYGETRLVANPKGYPTERRDYVFKPDFVVEVGA